MIPKAIWQNGAIPIGDKEVPLWYVVARAGFGRTDLAPAIKDAFGQTHRWNLLSSCRGVSSERLPVILSTGCDVEPSNAPLFVASIEKALEYGHDRDQVIQVFDRKCLRPSFCERDADLSQEERAEIERDYPNVIPSVDGSTLWFTRLAPSDTRAATGYEREYGYWIPGDPVEALCALILIFDDPVRFLQDLTSVLQHLNTSQDGVDGNLK